LFFSRRLLTPDERNKSMVTVFCCIFVFPINKTKAKEGFFSIKIEKLSFFETVCVLSQKLSKILVASLSVRMSS